MHIGSETKTAKTQVMYFPPDLKDEPENERRTRFQIDGGFIDLTDKFT